ncbi:MAG: DNA recombination protein RmuC [Bacteroidales bacterium]|nr:DNA recombination protein RmuC [Bacteroidales bacterium]
MILHFLIGFLSGTLMILILFLWLMRKKNREIQNLILKNRILKAGADRDQTELAELKDQLAQKEEQLVALNREVSSKSQEIKQLLVTNDEKKKDLEETLEKMNREFKILANDLLEEKTKKFTEQHTVRLNEILTPFKEQISGFERKVEETYKSNLKDQTDLKAELKKLQDLNLKISDEANNLTRALKGDVKKQGNWGEMVLERILERSGLIRGEEYDLQVALQNEEGKRIQPDVVVYLPENKHLMIDAKVSLVAYERLINEENEEKRLIHLKEHIISIKKHIKELSEKNYSRARSVQTPEFVLLFIPIESSFSLAVREDTELFNEAWDKQIIIVSPTTLLATLMTISSLWKQAKQSRHAQLIAEQGAKLYEKLKGFLEDFIRIGDRLTSAQNSYEEAHKKLTTGQGNLIKKAEKLKKLGIPTHQKLPDKFRDFEDTEE